MLCLPVLASGAQQASERFLAPGDQLRISVWKNPEMSGDFTIAPNGTIIHPLYREIQVTGVPVATIEERLRAFLATYLANPQLVVQPLVRIVVGGEVRNPNVYSVSTETTIMQAIALAGGPTDRGRMDQVTVRRNDADVILNLLSGGVAAGRQLIVSGDEIAVGRRRPSYYPVFNSIVGSIGAIAALYSVLSR